MIEAGLQLLIEEGLGAQPAPGFMVQLPPNQISATASSAWTVRAIISEATYVLEGQDGLTVLEIQVDCHGYTMANAISLAYAIDNVLRGGFAGTLPDTDATVVQGIFRKEAFIDGYSDANRSYVRSLEYECRYSQI